MIRYPTTVEDFLAPSNTTFRNIYLEGEREFVGLYVRKGPRYIQFPDGEGRMFDNVLQIARAEAVRPKTGALRRFIARVDKFTKGQLPIYVENVLNPEAAEGLEKSSLGFVLVDQTVAPAPCFLLLRPLTNTGCTL